jgi:cellulase/cellobiase CelA1
MEPDWLLPRGQHGSICACSACPVDHLGEVRHVRKGHQAQSQAEGDEKQESGTDTPVTVAYKTVSGTATDGDFTPVTGTLTFAPGETKKIVTVKVAGDALPEANETFQFALSSPTGATLAKASATATIINDDGGTTTPPSTSALKATTTITNDWRSGFTANVTVKNTGTTDVDAWTLKLKTPVDISNIWNTKIVSHSDDIYLLNDAGWNRTIATGQEVTFGFQATPGQPSTTSFDWVL